MCWLCYNRQSTSSDLPKIKDLVERNRLGAYFELQRLFLNDSFSFKNKNVKNLYWVSLLLLLNGFSCTRRIAHHVESITPNQFKGNDTERIQAAVDQAAKSTGRVVIPATNGNGSGMWLLDSAILLPSNVTVILENCTLQMSDQSRDNMFRSNNVGLGIENPGWNHNIHIIGMGAVTLKGADHPRSTGDSSKKLSLTPNRDIKQSGNYHISYGSDAGKPGVKQTGDWRNILILMAYVDGFTLKNVAIEETHAWAVSHERVWNAELSNIRINNPETSVIGGQEQVIRNRDGINLRHGCKNFRIDNISGKTGDDFVALSTLGTHADDPEGGTFNSTMVTSRRWHGPEDDTEQVFITNIVCESATRAVAIRANDEASTHHVFVDGVIFHGGYNTLLVGGRGYGRDSQPGKINNIHAMNMNGDGQSLILIEEAIANCSFMNGVYRGDGDQIIRYGIEESHTRNIMTQNLTRVYQE